MSDAPRKIPEMLLWGTSTEFENLADAWWQEAIDLGPAHKLSAEDRAYQARCFERAADFHARAVVMSAREADTKKVAA